MLQVTDAPQSAGLVALAEADRAVADVSPDEILVDLRRSTGEAPAWRIGASIPLLQRTPG